MAHRGIRGVPWTQRRFAATLVVVGVMLTPTVSAQEAAFKMPDGGAVSPENEKVEGEAGYRILHEGTGMELVYVPGGRFTMGSVDHGPGAEQDETPQHEPPGWLWRVEFGD